MQVNDRGADFAEVFAASGIGARRNQQDSYCCAQRGKALFAVVADGMGGMAHGAELGAIVANSMSKGFLSGAADLEPRMELIALMSGAQSAAEDYLESIGGGHGGSTAVAVIIEGDRLCCASAGDSRVGLVRAGGLLWLNRADSLGFDLDDKVARGVLPMDAAKDNPRRTAMTNYIGIDGVLKIDACQFPIRLLDGDAVLLLSDGVFGTLSEAEIEQAVRADDPAGAAASAIERKRLSTQDNYTAVIIRLNWGTNNEKG